MKISGCKMCKSVWQVMFTILCLQSGIYQTISAQETDNTSDIIAQEFKTKSDSSTKKHHRSIQVFPTIFYTPETNFAFGASGLAIFKVVDADNALRNSFISLSTYATINQQILFLLKHEINFTKHFLIRGELGYYKYPDVYAGYGNDHPVNEFENFDAIYPRIKIDFLKRQQKHFIYGLRYTYQNTNIIEIEKGGLLDTDQPIGYSGSVFSAIGLVANYDSRNFVFAPTKGWYTEVSFVTSQKIIGASFVDYTLQLDFRKYIPLLKNHTLAFQFISELHFGEPAFNHTAIIGGRYSIRGYRYGVLRDLNSFIFQSEYRSNRFLKFFSGTVFGALGGVGDTYGNSLLNARISYGVGLWIYPQPKKRLFVRLDYAQGWDSNKSQGFYVSMGNAF